MLRIQGSTFTKSEGNSIYLLKTGARITNSTFTSLALPRDSAVIHLTYAGQLTLDQSIFSEIEAGSAIMIALREEE